MRAAVRFELATLIFLGIGLAIGLVSAGCQPTESNPVIDGTAEPKGAGDSASPSQGDSRTQEGSGDSATASDAGARTHLDAIEGMNGGGDTLRPVSLCVLVREYFMPHHAGSGVYLVTEIYKDANDPGWAYVRIERESEWTPNSPAQATLMVRTSGRVSGRIGTTYGLSARKGERFGFLLVKARNGKPLPIMRTGIFEKVQGGYTNGIYFKENPISLQEIGKKVRDMWDGLKAGKGCPYDVKPYIEPDEERSNADAGQVRGGEEVSFEGGDGG